MQVLNDELLSFMPIYKQLELHRLLQATEARVREQIRHPSRPWLWESRQCFGQDEV
jgi:hypothetical protein